jgi:hypothetical protein
MEDPITQIKTMLILRNCLILMNVSLSGDYKSKVHARTGHEGSEGEKYSCTLSLTSVINEGGWSSNALAALHTGKTQYPMYCRLGGPQGRSGPVRKIAPPPRFDPWSVEPVASHYAD